MSNNTDDPVTAWIQQLQDGKSHAAQGLWEHFFNRLQDLAKRKMAGNAKQLYDEEDAALSAFHSLCKGIPAGRFPDLNDRSSLWRLLVTITYRKISRRRAYETRQKRNVKMTVASRRNSEESSEFGFDPIQNLEAIEPTPEFAAEAKENLERLVEQLEDENLCQICCMKLEGFRDDEIAEKLNCSRRTVQRKVELIRKIWEKAE